MGKWQFTKGLHDLGGGCFAYLQPNGGWGWSNAGLVVDGEANLLIDTLFDLKLTQEMLDNMRDSVPSTQKIKTLVNTHANGDHTFGNQLIVDAEIITSTQTASEMLERPPEFIKRLKANRAQLGEGALFLYDMMAKNFDWEDVVYTAPTRTFLERLDLEVGDKEVQLIYAGPAHRRHACLPSPRQNSVCRRPSFRGRSSGDLGGASRELDKSLRQDSQLGR